MTGAGNISIVSGTIFIRKEKYNLPLHARVRKECTRRARDPRVLTPKCLMMEHHVNRSRVAVEHINSGSKA